MKFIKPILLASSLFALQASATDDSYWNGYAKIYPNAFNVTYVEFTNGFNFENTGHGTVAIWDVGGTQDVQSFLNYYQTYVDELEHDIMYRELLEVEKIACPMNEDRTDNKAYRVVTFSDLIFRTPDSKVLSFRHGDVVGGSDWDNDGKIDILENLPMISQGGRCNVDLD